MQWLYFIVKQLDLMAYYVKASSDVYLSFTRITSDNPHPENCITLLTWQNTLKQQPKKDFKKSATRSL